LSKFLKKLVGDVPDTSVARYLKLERR